MADATISNLQDRTTRDTRTGAVRSVQAAELEPSRGLEELWSPANLERLARTYWRFLARVTLGLVRVRYSERARSVVLLVRPLKLLTFAAPEYEMDAERGVVRWRIARGLLVARAAERDGRGTPADRGAPRARSPTRASRARLHIEVEVANFYPAIASGLSRRLYNATQSRIHVLVTHGFLRSLARLDLAEGGVPKLAVSKVRAPPGRPRRLRRSPADRAQLRAVVRARDAPHSAGARAHDERFGGGATGARVAHALQHVPVGDAGGGEEDVVPGHQVVAVEDAVEVVARRQRRLALGVVARPQPSERSDRRCT